MSDKRIVLTTAASQEEAQKIARALVKRGLAACVNISGPMQSIYRWKGEMEEASERALAIKTTAASFESVRDAIRELHSYELPECLALKIEDGSSEYLAWMDESVKARR